MLTQGNGRLLACLLLAACAGGRHQDAPAHPPAANAVAPLTAPSAAPSSPAAPPPPSAAPAAPPRASDAPPARGAKSESYPPAPFQPPHERSAQPGDGQWTAFGGPRDRAGAGTPVLHKTTLHPHATSRFIEMVVLAIDLTAVKLHFMPGVEDVGKLAVPFTPGLVPDTERNALLAVFNGGFQPRHGRWGMRLGEATILPPRDTGCSIALGADGNVQIRTHTALAANAQSSPALRQTPPCILERGSVHADLLAGRDKPWGGRTAGIVTRRRSALGIDASGRVLFYAIGIEATPRLLAEGLRAAGATDAAQLDINWNWTRFLLFGEDESGTLGVSTALVEAEYAKTGYVTRPSERDFFYLVRR